MPAPGNFSFGRALREWCFVQVPLLSLRNLQKAAKERGLSDLGLFSRDPWEVLDSEEILPPVAYSLDGSWDWEVPARIDEGYLLVREEAGYRPWGDLQIEAQNRHGAELTVLYHHWQLFALAEVQAALRVPLIPGNLGDGLGTYYDARERIARVGDVEKAREDLRRFTAVTRGIELLLVRVQNLFMPRERDGRYRAGVVLGLTEDAADWVIAERERFDYAAAAEDCGVSADDLRELYEGLGFRAHGIDPNERLFWLLDQLARRQKERLKGDALRALDYYDAARVLRRWHRELTGEWAPDVDELIGIGADKAKERLFGKRDIRYDRSVLPALLDNFGLYPWRVELIGEGESELAALGEILDYGYGLSFARMGIHTTPMRTADTPENAELLLASMREYANYFLLVFDNEGRARELIEGLLRMGVIEGVSDSQRAEKLKQALTEARGQTFASDDERREALKAAVRRGRELEVEPGEAPEFNLWRENLEADNFDLGELCGVVKAEAARQEVAGFSITEEEVKVALEEEAKRPVKDRRAVATVILDIAERKRPPLRLSKPDYARLLGRFAVDHPERAGRQRPILELAQHLVMLTGADRMLRGELR